MSGFLFQKGYLYKAKGSVSELLGVWIIGMVVMTTKPTFCLPVLWMIVNATCFLFKQTPVSIHYGVTAQSDI